MLSLEEMGVSLPWRRLHDINPDLFHVLVSTEDAVQEALCVGIWYGQSLAFSALHSIFNKCRNVRGKQTQRCEYKYYVFIATAHVADCART